MAEQPFNWRPTIRRRVTVAAVLFVVWAVGIEARLGFLQIASHDDLMARAARQQQKTIEAPAKRGEIYDRDGRLLAYSVDADTIYAVPSEIEEPASVAARVCEALGDCSAAERRQLEQRFSTDREFAYVRRRVSPAEAKRVAALDLAGIGFMKESRRFYPNRELAAHLLGYVGLDNVGLSGLEAAYDKVIRGRSGTLLVQTDARQHAFSRLERTPTSGGSLELTIDEQIQYIVERELEAGVIENKAASGSAVVMDPRTGEILALANYPTFNPNVYGKAPAPARRNRAIQDLYEPGSTFKVVTASAALEEHVVSPDDLIDATGGTIRLGGWRTVRDTHDYGVMTFRDVIVKSSNVGAIKVGLRLGPERLGLYVNRFGFGQRTSPDFPGESPGIVWDPAKLNDSALASVSMGYQVGVTPIQMAAAVSAVANGGHLLQPRVVRAWVRDGVRTVVEPKVVREAIRPETAAVLTGIMEEVVEKGTATLAKVPGFRVAGKTGTAAKLVNGRYSKSDYNASFVGFVPARNPEFTIIVVIDSPHAKGYYGGGVAGPIFQRIATAALRQHGVAPTLNPAPPVVVARHEAASPLTAASARLDEPRIVTLQAGADGDAVVPDLRGLSARDALRTLARLGLTARLRGDGIVVEQSLEPGTPLERGSVCTLELGREPGRLAGASGEQP
ncbi:MAG: penicillin-binding protein [Vicinamibacterales bacterium]